MPNGVQDDLASSSRRPRKVWTRRMHSFERRERCIELGSIHIWDLLFKQDEPALSIKVGPCYPPLTTTTVACS